MRGYQDVWVLRFKVWLPISRVRSNHPRRAYALPNVRATSTSSPTSGSTRPRIVRSSASLPSNERFFFKSVHHSHNFLHNHPTNRPRTNSHFKAHMRPILPIQSPFSNTSSLSRKFLPKRFLSRDFHVTGGFDHFYVVKTGELRNSILDYTETHVPAIAPGPHLTFPE